MENIIRYRREKLLGNENPVVTPRELSTEEAPLLLHLWMKIR